jgi:hypothetical protein
MSKTDITCNIDLNIDNYSYKELLGLFKLTYDFNEYELKQAKKIVLMTHPDKCGYDKEVFLFFSKAYKLLYSVYVITHKQHTITSTNYTMETNDEMKEFYKKFSKSKDFNKKFNELFESIKVNDENDDGYAEWLKSQNTDTDNLEYDTKITNMDMMNVAIERKKQHIRAMIVKEEMNDVGFGNTNIVSSNLDHSKPTYYESNMFGKLKYDDVKRVYTETVVPVTNEDFYQKEKFNSIDSYKRHREIVIRSEDNDYLNKVNYIKQQQKEKISDELRAYNMVRQDEKNRERINKWNRHFLRLKN